MIGAQRITPLAGLADPNAVRDWYGGILSTASAADAAPLTTDDIRETMAFLEPGDLLSAAAIGGVAWIARGIEYAQDHANRGI